MGAAARGGGDAGMEAARGWGQRGAAAASPPSSHLPSPSLLFFSPSQRLYHPDYNNELTQFLPRTVVLKKPPGAQVGPPPPEPLILLKSPPTGAEGGEELPATSRELLLCAMVGVCLVLQLGFNIRGGKASQLGIFISKVCPMGAAGTGTGPVCVPWPLPLMNALHGR